MFKSRAQQPSGDDLLQQGKHKKKVHATSFLVAVSGYKLQSQEDDAKKSTMVGWWETALMERVWAEKMQETLRGPRPRLLDFISE